MPGPASRLYAQNVVNLLTLMTSKAEGDGAGPGGVFAPDFDDEIVAGSCVTHGGQIRHEPTRVAVEGPPEGLTEGASS
jgi:NAD(P) transhydrogenase subunit alpha